MSLDVRIFRNIQGVEPALWDSLMRPEDILMSHRFVKSCQNSGVADAEYWHLTVFEGSVLQCVASLSEMNVSIELLSGNVTRATARIIRKVKPRFLQVPVLFCGLPVSFGQPCLRLRSDAPVSSILGAIASQMETIARQRDIPLLCFKEFDPRLAAETEPLCGLGYFRVPSLPSCSLPLRWRSFEDYVASMRSAYRRQIRSTIRTREASGLEVRVLEDFGGRLESIFALYGNVMDRAAHQLERLNRSFFEELNGNLGVQARAITLEHEGDVLAAAIVLHTPALAIFLLAGIDYSRNHQYQSYPNIVLAVVAEAIRSGARRLEMGQTSYALKSRMGALLVPRYLYLRHRSSFGHSLLKRASGWLYPAVNAPDRRVFRCSEPGCP